MRTKTRYTKADAKEIPPALRKIAVEAIKGGATLPTLIAAIRQSPHAPAHPYKWWWERLLPISKLRAANRVAHLDKIGKVKVQASALKTAHEEARLPISLPRSVNLQAARIAREFARKRKTNRERVYNKLASEHADRKRAAIDESVTRSIVDAGPLDPEAEKDINAARLAQMRRALRSQLPISRRVRILVNLAKQTDQPQVAAKALERIDQIEGMAVLQKETAPAPTTRPLFAFAPGMMMPALTASVVPIPVSESDESEDGQREDKEDAGA